MGKIHLRSLRVSDAASFVEEAAHWARTLVHAESRRPGDYGNAMRRVARKARVPFSALWALHYRLPKSVGVEIYVALGDAVNEQRNRYREERQHVEARTALGRALLRAADGLAGEEDEDVNS